MESVNFFIFKIYNNFKLVMPIIGYSLRVISLYLSSFTRTKKTFAKIVSHCSGTGLINKRLALQMVAYLDGYFYFVK